MQLRIATIFTLVCLTQKMCAKKEEETICSKEPAAKNLQGRVVKELGEQEQEEEEGVAAAYFVVDEDREGEGGKGNDAIAR